MKKFDVYYLWLLDMNKFNYKNFQSSWIGEYPTRYYFEKIATSSKVKKAVEKQLKTNFNSKIENDYLNIFIRKTWQKT